ncbi:DUF7289 family protein [Methanolobus profundi]|uniref:Uncharacterized protein n=1 Tax=Methanolobus profundi TaxID=487685 RepID=A0A1I4SRR0_9EURY|nr:hypothetical protein [Methanolobus profundi]SFM67154.1 hypothetical protein SAMN04488696_1980 [Methanolobus profundi]
MIQQDRKDSAVSETLGYILLFGIVTLSMGVIYTVGYPVLQSNMDSNIFESAEQSFIVLQSGMDRVAFDQVPLKILKMKLQGSSLAISNTSSVTITYDGNPPLNITTGDLVFEKAGKKISYELGGVFKSYPPDSTVMVSQPPIYAITSDNVEVTTIGIVSLKGSDYVSGRGIATLTIEHGSSTMERTTSPTNVDIQINSPYAPRWAEYLEDNGFSVTNITSSSVHASKNNTILILSLHEIDVDIS